MRVLFAAAEFRPLVSVGGLAEAASGLMSELREGEAGAGIEIVVALPDYFGWKLPDARKVVLDVPDWAAPATARLGVHPEAGPVAFIDVPGIRRPDPYVDENGKGWADNATRFAAFAAAIAALAREIEADLVHLNDWHTALAPSFMDGSVPSILTIHSLGHQGWFEPEWIERLPSRREDYTVGDSVNALAGAIRSVDKVVAVSPNYAAEIVTEVGGMGLDQVLAARQGDVIGIRNGIDVRVWNPRTDAFAPKFDSSDMVGKDAARALLLTKAGWIESADPLVVMVSRFVEQKGVDLAFEAARFLAGMKVRMMVLGSGDPRLAEWGHWLAESQPDRFWFHEGYDGPLSHLMFAGGDLFLMPSRYEPCGLAQMQAMAYGTIPVVTAVGGLVDTVVDADSHPDGNGFVAAALDESGLVDAMHRAARAVRHPGRRRALQRRGMETDWSWNEPARKFVDLYHEVCEASPVSGAPMDQSSKT